MNARPTRIVLALALVAGGLPAGAYVVNINPGQRALYLQVGVGTFTGTFATGGTPSDNATVNSVSVNVPAASVGAGVVAMTTDSTVTASPYDGFTFCTVPAQVYVGGFYRTPGFAGNATLSVTSPASLTSAAGDAIPFSNISWISSGIGDATPTIPSGTFVGGAQNLLSVTRNTWFESCLAFRYANNQLVAAGTFTGRVTFTLSTP